MPVPADWYPHRRPDGEIVGWIVPDLQGFRAVDLLGRAVGSTSVDWLVAEALLEDRGIGYLADRYTLRLPDGSERPVRIAETSSEGITVVADEFGMASAVGAVHERFRLSFPAPEDLQPRP
ncbi:hypothetical protein [Microbacterium caowuchunii]|uniref:Uncharacterized protein n=1 Tax=Microbacterium caowuchunii TaxID=2614638 RepID=A0A5N0TLM8_9MICO|nr:hypothetical protein [Microbacterium caowuchunii]KAA9134866.1 hypothetical protein F6B40_04000 [Microbacterium caowuchunii]